MFILGKGKNADVGGGSREKEKYKVKFQVLGKFWWGSQVYICPRVRCFWKLCTKTANSVIPSLSRSKVLPWIIMIDEFHSIARITNRLVHNRVSPFTSTV